MVAHKVLALAASNYLERRMDLTLTVGITPDDSEELLRLQGRLTIIYESNWFPFVRALVALTGFNDTLWVRRALAIH